jgi:class 3 adenylate cyclase/predicted ATPase
MPVPVPSAREAEWRQMTVMFCDLVGSTELAHQVDAEDLREIIRAYQGLCTRIVDGLDGLVARYMGDGMMIYFGYPMAHEDDAERAVRAGLQIVEAVEGLDAGLGREKGAALAVRVGLATGRVLAGDLIGEGASEEKAVLGETPNLAARLEAVAEPGTVVIAPGTLELLKGLVEHEDAGLHQLKGFPEPVAVTRVVRMLEGESRFDAARAKRHLTPMVGRVDEVAMLKRRWEQAREGEGHVILLSGEPGIGKSRLIQALIDHIAGEPHLRWRYQCSSQHTNSALYPVITQLERSARFERGDTAQRRLAKLTALVAEATDALQGLVPVLALLLNIPTEGSDAAPDASPQRQKDQTLQALIGLLESSARKRPVLLVFEDVHWTDPTTLELLHLIVDKVAALPALMLVTFRPDFSPAWVGEPHVTLLTLNRLSEREGAEMVRRLAQDARLPAEALHQIVDKTDGVPLFVEELTMLLMQSGSPAGRGAAAGVADERMVIPSTLQDSLTARLDQLGDAKDVVQIGAAIGREFDYDLLRSVAPWEEEVLLDKLDRLVDLLQWRGVAPRLRYAFKHALVQEAAYTSLLKRTRSQYHARIADSLEAHFPDICATQPELIAQHHSQGGQPGKAVQWWLRAGQRALAQFANIEAIHHLENGLKALAQLPESERGRHIELELQTSLGPALCATRGYAAPEVERAYERGRELCRQIGSVPELFSVQWGLWAYHVVRADLGLALETGEEMRRLAEAADDVAWRIESSLAIGLTRYFQGRPAAALTELEQAIGLDTPERDRSFTRRSGQDAVVCALTYAGLALWLLGRHAAALARSREAIALARELDHPFSLAYALNFGGWLCFMLRDPEQAIRLAEEEIALSDEQGFFWTALGRVTRGWARGQRGEVHEGLEEIRGGIAAYRTPGARLSATLLLAMEAETCALADDPATGLECVEAALAAARDTGEKVWLAELHRRGAGLRGGAEVEPGLRRALGEARAQGAHGLVLRVALDLARALIAEDRFPEAADVLRPARAAVTGGSRLPDLSEADVLLAELERTVAR